ncbi:MAG: hypothetical protein AAFR39_13365 [Pseudomonadota bacterium]
MGCLTRLVSDFGCFAVDCFNTIFIGCDDGLVVGSNKPVEQLFFLLLELFDLSLKRVLFERRAIFMVAADFLEDRQRQIKQIPAWHHSFQYGLKFAFDLFPSNGLAMAWTAFGIAQIIRIVLFASLRPTSCVSLPAMIAADKAA